MDNAAHTSERLSSSSVYTPSVVPTQTFYNGTGGVTITPIATATPTTTDACGQVAALSASVVAASPSATVTVPAEIGYACLNSIPFNQTAAVQLLDSIDPYLNWQSTLEWLADPPADVSTELHAALPKEIVD